MQHMTYVYGLSGRYQDCPIAKVAAPAAEVLTELQKRFYVDLDARESGTTFTVLRVSGKRPATRKRPATSRTSATSELSRNP